MSATTATPFPVTVSTTSRTAVIFDYRVLPLLWSGAAVLLGLALLVASWRRSFGKAAFGLATLVLLFLRCACGGGSSSSVPASNPNGTLAGTYTLTVTATPTSGAAQSVQLTLIVQ